MARCYLALGSNLGDREAHLQAAVSGLADRGVRLVRSASVYSTDPKEVIDQPWFLNTVIEVETALDPESLMRACLEVEQSRGRVRGQPRGPRTLDIDAIFYDDRVIDTDLVQVPHPRYASRRFVLEPLAEIAAGFVDPARKRTVAAMLAALADESVVERVGGPL